MWVTPAWLPEGSSFVFTLDDKLCQYDLSNGQVVLLARFYLEYVANPSPPPDGGYIVFERQRTGTPVLHDLWIMNRHHPVEIVPLTGDGRSSNPDWGRVP